MDLPVPTNQVAGVSRYSPRAKGVVLFGEVLADIFPDRQIAGGAPFNVACHLSAFGALPLLASRLGADGLGDELRNAMLRFALATDLLQIDAQRQSGRVTVVATENGHRFEIAPDQAFDFIDGSELTSALAKLASPPSLVYFGTLAQRNPVSRAALESLQAATDAPCFVDLNLRSPWAVPEIAIRSLQKAAIAKLSEDELHAVAGWLNIDSSNWRTAARAIASRFDTTQLIVTRGERGAWCLHQGAELEVPVSTAPAPSGDAVGAGDAYSAVTILGHLRHWSPVLAMERASRFAAAVCGIRGATPADLGLYVPFVSDWEL